MPRKLREYIPTHQQQHSVHGVLVGREVVKVLTSHLSHAFRQRMGPRTFYPGFMEHFNKQHSLVMKSFLFVLGTCKNLPRFSFSDFVHREKVKTFPVIGTDVTIFWVDSTEGLIDFHF